MYKNASRNRQRSIGRGKRKGAAKADPTAKAMAQQERGAWRLAGNPKAAKIRTKGRVWRSR